MLRVPFKCLKLLECKNDTKSGSAKTQAPQQPALQKRITLNSHFTIKDHKGSING